jgi:sulfate permease, SulP family
MNAVWQRFKSFNNVWDSRFEDLTRDSWLSTLYRDASAGLIVALTAIPMAMGFAMAMGMRPEQGIVAGAVACLVGRTWGGSKYQVYGPTAAFIPIIAGLIFKYRDPEIGGSFEIAHGFLILCSVTAGVVLMLMGLAGMGRYAKLVPNSIVVGFTIGIAIVIAFSNIGSALGIRSEIKGDLFEKIHGIVSHIDQFNIFALALALMTFFLTRYLIRISVYIPGPLISLAIATLLAATLLSGSDIVTIREAYKEIPTNFFVLTLPVFPNVTTGPAWVVADLLYFVAAIVFVSAIESLLCSSMADRLADNRKTPFNPDKEFWGQGLVQIITPLLNGFPCTGALARTATSIKAGAVTPFAGYFKGVLKLTLAYFMASYLELVPMACIGGILLWVASNMVKPAEIKEVWRHNRFHAFLMVFTAVMVPLTDFLTGVLAALILYGVLYRFFDSPPAKPTAPEKHEQEKPVPEPAAAHI